MESVQNQKNLDDQMPPVPPLLKGGEGGYFFKSILWSKSSMEGVQ